MGCGRPAASRGADVGLGGRARRRGRRTHLRGEPSDRRAREGLGGPLLQVRPHPRHRAKEPARPRALRLRALRGPAVRAPRRPPARRPARRPGPPAFSPFPAPFQGFPSPLAADPSRRPRVEAEASSRRGAPGSPLLFAPSLPLLFFFFFT